MVAILLKGDGRFSGKRYAELIRGMIDLTKPVLRCQRKQGEKAANGGLTGWLYHHYD